MCSIRVIIQYNHLCNESNKQVIYEYVQVEYEYNL